jgi:predicted neutral ceramidase superfamily lipid hydrolase
MGDHHILPLELVVLTAVWYLPPLVIASLGQIYVLRNAGVWISSRVTCTLAVLITYVLSPVIGYFALPLPIPRWLGASDNMLFLPMAFIIVALVALFTTYGAVTYARKIA